MKKLVLAFCVTAVLISSCKKEDKSGTSNADYISNADCTGSAPTYTADVQPILSTQCATSGCHNTATAAHGLNLEGYTAAKNNFNAHETLCAINHGSGCSPMPEGLPKLSEAEIKTITCWAKNNFPN